MQPAVTSATQIRKPEPLSVRLVIAADRLIYRVARRWLLLFNGMMLAWALAAVAASLLRATGLSGVARPIYGLFSVLCHQDPHRSFHLAGHQVACCHRCLAIYGTCAGAGVAFGLLRGRLRSPRLWEAGALLAPAAIDVLGGLVGLWESTFLGRLMTGVLFGIAMIWLLWPYFDRGFATMRLRLEALFTRLVAEGRARPL